MPYEWLQDEPSPRLLKEAIKLLGTKEKVGKENNPVILAWAKELNLNEYTMDSIPWCGLFMAYIAKKADKPVVDQPLWARSWVKFGKPSEPELGAVLVFRRDSGGHVGLYVGEDDDCYHVLGGNQSDSVSIVRINKERLLAARAIYNNRPLNIRKIYLKPTGSPSINEA
jgi:uncharacterized protein (TIGR02594 family)